MKGCIWIVTTDYNDWNSDPMHTHHLLYSENAHVLSFQDPFDLVVIILHGTFKIGYRNFIGWCNDD